MQRGHTAVSSSEPLLSYHLQRDTRSGQHGVTWNTTRTGRHSATNASSEGVRGHFPSEYTHAHAPHALSVSWNASVSRSGDKPPTPLPPSSQESNDGEWLRPADGLPDGLPSSLLARFLAWIGAMAGGSGAAPADESIVLEGRREGTDGNFCVVRRPPKHTGRPSVAASETSAPGPQRPSGTQDYVLQMQPNTTICAWNALHVAVAETGGGSKDHCVSRHRVQHDVLGGSSQRKLSAGRRKHDRTEYFPKNSNRMRTMREHKAPCPSRIDADLTSGITPHVQKNVVPLVV